MYNKFILSHPFPFRTCLRLKNMLRLPEKSFATRRRPISIPWLYLRVLSHYYWKTTPLLFWYLRFSLMRFVEIRKSFLKNILLLFSRCRLAFTFIEHAHNKQAKLFFIIFILITSIFFITYIYGFSTMSYATFDQSIAS